MPNQASQHLAMLAATGDFATSLLRLGIVDGFARLRSSAGSPEQLVNGAKSELRLLLKDGDKFLCTDWFERTLQRRRALELSFLLSDQTQLDSLDHIRDMASKFSPRLQVRLYANRPDLRMVFVDKHYLILSHYAAERLDDVDSAEDEGADHSWEAPHLRIDCRGLTTPPNMDYSLYPLFDHIWRERWSDATILDSTQPSSPSENRRNHE